ncbi:hypothetical protein ACFSQ3_07130 [Sphingobacterium corticis]|uniref:Mobilization protein n=1 Tax=Sphingobacterium corticis TaxID=1812823 RepID=A0ABW5NI76_9SPHI
MKKRKLHNDEKRVFEVKIRLNIGEKQKLEKIIDRTNSHAPDIFRKLLMKGKLPDASVPLLDIQTYYQLRKIGLTYNAYMKAINQARITEIDRNIGKQVSDILDTVQYKIRKS